MSCATSYPSEQTKTNVDSDFKSGLVGEDEKILFLVM
jgi:hypothetical protein